MAMSPSHSIPACVTEITPIACAPQTLWGYLSLFRGNRATLAIWVKTSRIDPKWCSWIQTLSRTWKWFDIIQSRHAWLKSSQQPVYRKLFEGAYACFQETVQRLPLKSEPWKLIQNSCSGNRNCLKRDDKPIPFNPNVFDWNHSKPLCIADSMRVLRRVSRKPCNTWHWNENHENWPEMVLVR